MLRLRVDDFPGVKREEFHRHNLENFRRFHEVVRGHFPGYVLGVIPDRVTIEQCRWLRNNPEVTVAMHGVVHDESKPDEFGGLPFRVTMVAMDMPRAGLQKFVERPVVDYIPPHNAFSENTTLALSRLGFKHIYGGPGSTDGVPLHGLELRYSRHPVEYGRSDELLNRDGSVEHIHGRLEAGDDVWLTLHWTWEQNIGLDNLTRYLSELCTGPGRVVQ
jgi:hypothetical protein